MSKYTFPELHESGFSGRDSRMAFVRRMVTLHEFKTAKLCRQAELSIINESTDPDCGENVGTSSNPSAAPEVAASDDDDGGDGDGEDDRRRPGRPRNTRNNTFPAAAEHFDRLPDSALVGIATVKALTSKSRATVYRWMDRGLFPRPCKIGTTHNLWRAGDIRRALSA